MTKPKLLSAALIAAAMLATPATARQSYVTSQHRAKDVNASTMPGARYIGEGDGNHFGGGFGGPPDDNYGGYGKRVSGLHGGPRGYEGRDAWGHWGTYYGPIIPAVP